ncbi:MAG TPA: aminotransferase class IV [Candidatus Norongarragalinales archaeon]|nr:aminotransferase class IV [Candidatus Norongarragalinales archaeon]
MLAYLNGSMESDAKISIYDEGLLYGLGVYETLRVYERVAFRVKEHLLRLKESAEEIGLQCPPTSIVEKAIRQTIEHNGLDQAALRVVLTAGSTSDWGQSSQSLIVMAKRLEAMPKTFKAVTVPFHRDVAKAKTLNCLTAVMARRHALAHQADEALFTFDGNVLEGTTSNLFIVRDNALCTPRKNVLEGITRNAVLDLAKSQGIRVCEEPISIENLYQVDEAFLTSTLKEVVPLSEVDGKHIPEGPMAQQLHASFSKRVRDEIQGKK